jgi:hypothetical protein
VAFVVNHGIATCLSGQTGAATTGAGTVLAYAAQAGLDSYGLGFSLTNAFEVELPVFNGEKMLQFLARPTIYDRVSLAIGGEKIHSSLEDLITIRCVSTRGISIFNNNEPADEATTSSALTSFDAEDAANDLLAQLQNVHVEAYIVTKLNLVFNITKLPVIGKIIPAIEVAFLDASTFISTGQRSIVSKNLNDTMTVYPGISIFAGRAQDNAAINQVLDGILIGLKTVFDISKELGIVGFDTSQILNFLQLERLDDKTYYGIALTANTHSSGFRLTLPFMSTGMVSVLDLILQCTVPMDSQATPVLNCRFELGGLDQMFRLALEGALWVFRAINSYADRHGKIIAASIERAGQQAGELFSPENVGRTFSEILAGTLNVDDELRAAANIGYTLFSYCEEGQSWDDGTMCIGDPTGIRPKVGTCCNCKNDDTFWIGKVKNGETNEWYDGNGNLRACGTERH